MKVNVIKLPGVLNARELGGYPAGNRTVRSGVLIRSGVLNKAEPGAIDILSAEYHVQTVVDFRMSGVRGGAPDKEIPGAGYIRLPVVEMEDYLAMVKDLKMAKQFMSGNADQRVMIDMAYESGLLSPDMYVMFLLGDRGKKAFAEFFRILLRTDPGRGAVLWHCVDGKDRAGLATMLLLSVLGTDKQTIIEDYLMSNSGKEEKLGKIRKDCESLGMPPEKIEALQFASGGVFERYMTHAIDTLENKYGCVCGYLTDELGLTEPDLEQLRERYTV